MVPIFWTSLYIHNEMHYLAKIIFKKQESGNAKVNRLHVEKKKIYTNLYNKNC